jgi:beta-N-acetylhexosaminidase
VPQLTGHRVAEPLQSRVGRRLAFALAAGLAVLSTSAVALVLLQNTARQSHLQAHPSALALLYNAARQSHLQAHPSALAERPPTATHTDPRTRPRRSAIAARRTSSQPDLSGLVGQLIVARFVGPEPSSAFLARIRAGQIGAVILFGDNNAGGPGATLRVVNDLQDAARQGDKPPLLIMTDQEGGDVRRLPGAPALAPAAMSSDAIAQSQGQATGELLRSVGINVDLAPVADVEATSGSFLGPRSFGSTPALVATRACAFARGLASAGVAYTLKHFPGLGLATVSTDAAPVSIPASSAELRADYGAYETCGAGPTALIMVSSASYPNLSGPLPAVMSRAIYQRELPIAVGRSHSLTISDDLQTPALAVRASPELTAVDAGLDLAMYATTEAGSATAYSKLLADARAGLLPLHRLVDAVSGIEALKKIVAH